MIIGVFKYHLDGDFYHGSIVMPGFSQHGVCITLVDDPRGSAPDYRLTIELEGAPEIPIDIGAGWRRANREDGHPFIAVVLDGPLLDKPIHASLRLGGPRGLAALVWNRPRPATKVSALPADA